MQRQGRYRRDISLFLASIFLLTACELPAGFDPTNPTASPTPNSSPQASPTPTPRSSATPAPTATPVVGGGIGSSKLGIELGIPDNLDMRQFDGPVVSQFGGTCSTFATAAAMDNVLKSKGIDKNVSERHLWDTYGVYDAWYAVDAAKKNYITEEKYWPINGSRASNYKDFATLRITQYKEFEYDWKPALQAMGRDKRPLVLAIQVPSDLANCKTDISATSGYTSGQHVIEAVGYKLDNSIAGGGYFIVKNSWGTDCGEKGYHYYPFQLCNRSDLYCYLIEVQDVEDKS
ncbi:MAG: hypothetical protein JST80_10420 [Bdellovibrionales bacterium]|nr:hypothetical protein [Bdellovibrionales bacterium]